MSFWSILSNFFQIFKLSVMSEISNFVNAYSWIEGFRILQHKIYEINKSAA